LAFEQFLVDVEERKPPSPTWVEAQRQKPEIAWDKWSMDQISNAHEEYRTRMTGRALQHLMGDRGLNLPDGWKDDFSFNFDIVQRQLSDLFELGTWPAPAYSGRIGVLLRRANRRDLSDRFEAAWARIVDGE